MIELENENWYELRVVDKQPDRRAYHSSFIFGHNLYIFGGHDISEGSMNSLWSFDISKIGILKNTKVKGGLIWTEIKTTGVKKPSKLKTFYF